MARQEHTSAGRLDSSPAHSAAWAASTASASRFLHGCTSGSEQRGGGVLGVGRVGGCVLLAGEESQPNRHKHAPLAVGLQSAGGLLLELALVQPQLVLRIPSPSLREPGTER